MVNIDVGDAGFGHVFDAVGAGGISDEHHGPFGLWGGVQASGFGVNCAAGVADAGVLADRVFDGVGPEIGADAEEEIAIETLSDKAGGDFIFGMLAVVNDVDCGLHVVKNTHEKPFITLLFPLYCGRVAL